MRVLIDERGLFMETIMPLFKDENDKTIMIISLILTIFFCFIPFLLVFLLLKDKLSENSVAISKAYLNFELLLFIISIGINLIPILGQIIGILFIFPAVLILNLIFPIWSALSISNNQPVKVPVLIKFIK